MGRVSRTYSSRPTIGLLPPPRTARGSVPGSRFYGYKAYNAQKPAINHDGSVMVSPRRPTISTRSTASPSTAPIGRVAVTRFDGCATGRAVPGEYQNGVAETAISVGPADREMSVAASSPTTTTEGSTAAWAACTSATTTGTSTGGRRPSTRTRSTRSPRPTTRRCLRQPVYARVGKDAARGVHEHQGAEFQNGGRVWIYDERADGTWSSYYNIDGDRDQLAQLRPRVWQGGAMLAVAHDAPCDAAEPYEGGIGVYAVGGVRGVSDHSLVTHSAQSRGLRSSGRT